MLTLVRDPEVRGDTPDPVERAVTRTTSTSRTRRIIASAAVLVAAIVILWPASYGGVTGLTLVRGNSMIPTYHTGDLVISVKFPSYLPGQIVSYTVPAGQPGAGGRVIHRIFSVSDSGVYTTKGDNNPETDPWHFQSSDVMGTALVAVPQVGSVLGVLSNPSVIGLFGGLLATLLLWRSDPKRERHSRHNHPAVVAVPIAPPIDAPAAPLPARVAGRVVTLHPSFGRADVDWAADDFVSFGSDAEDPGARRS
jgi:signal peptidase